MSSQLDLKQTLMRVVKSDQSRWPVNTLSFGQDLDLQIIAQNITGAEQLHAEPLILRFRSSYLVFFEFGELVIWEGNELDLIELMNGLPPQLANQDQSSAKESFDVLLEQSEEQVTFHGVHLQKLSVEHIKVISKIIAQSTALQRCDKQVGMILDEWRPTVGQLASTGRMLLSSKDLQSMIGRTLGIREATIGRMAVIDSPQEAWKSERLSRLHFELYERFRFSQRIAALEKKLQYLLDLNSTLINIVRHRQNHYLEWIVIILIVIEVIYSTIHFLLPNKH